MERTACILVDSGEKVDVDDLLEDDEYLTAILLTHAHADHYQTLASNLRDAAPIFTSNGTADVLETVLSDAERHCDTIGDTDAVLEAIEPIDCWESPIEGVRVIPVPAGHAPGATGFAIQFDGGSGMETVLATGDWTTQRFAGFSGFDSSLPLDVGAIFLTGATSDCYTDSLTDSVAAICKRVYAGSPVVTSASGLNGIKYAYLLGHFGQRFDHPSEVKIVGQMANLYEDLEYTVPNVEAIPNFDDPEDVLAPETVTIAGPEAPTEGSSGQLFGAIKNDATATLVQLHGGGQISTDSATCTTYDFELVPHPTETEIDAMVEGFDPMQVVVTHQRPKKGDRFKQRYRSFVWSNGTSDEYTLYEAGDWQAPPWMSAEAVQLAHRTDGSGESQHSGDSVVESNHDEKRVLPSCRREATTVDLAAEGLDLPALEEQLHVSVSENINTEEQSGQEGSSEDDDEPKPDECTGKPTEQAVSDESDEIRKTQESAQPSSQDIESILSRLDSIEEQLQGSTVPAKVVALV